MKNIIILVALIALGVFIGSNLIMGDTNSLKTGVEGINTQMVQQLKDYTP